MHSSSASVIYKMLAVFMLFCLSKASGGTCLSYGHSCWGGHGKRNGGGYIIGPTQKRTSEWYISKLFTPAVENSKNIEAYVKGLRPNYEEVDKFQQDGYKVGFYPVSDIVENNPREESVSSETKSNPWGVDGNESEEVVVLAPEVQQLPPSKYRFLEVLNQEDSKKRNPNKQDREAHLF